MNSSIFGLDVLKENAATVGGTALSTSRTALLVLCGCALFILIIKLIIDQAK